MNDKEANRKLEDILAAADRARTCLEIAGLQLSAMGRKDDPVLARIRTAVSVIRESRDMLMKERCA